MILHCGEVLGEGEVDVSCDGAAGVHVVRGAAGVGERVADPLVLGEGGLAVEGGVTASKERLSLGRGSGALRDRHLDG